MRRGGFLSAIRGYLRATASWTAATIFGSGAGYQILDPGRKVLTTQQRRVAGMTANELATASLPQLRSICRRLERDNPTARSAVEGVVAQVVGTGIALVPDHGDKILNERLRAVWEEYIAGCDITGERSIYDLQMQGMRDICVAGEILWRTPVLVERADAGLIPICVLPLECEWLAQDIPQAPADGLTLVAGVEVDKWGRPIAYHLRNPSSAFSSQTQRLPKSEIIHQFERRRALQNRGEPWLVPVIERIAQDGDLVDAELRGAITCSGIGVVIESAHGAPLDTTVYGTAADPAFGVGVGSVARILPGEKVTSFAHNRPGQQIAAFRAGIRGDISASMRISQRWLDRDYGRANFSSMRADNGDQERLLSPVREWYGHATIGALYLRALPFLAIKAGVPMPKRIAYRLLPDKTPYVDPLKEVDASAKAIAAGLSTHEAEISKTGGDINQVWAQLVIERDKLAELGLSFDLGGTKPAATAPAGDQQEFAPTDAAKGDA